MGQEKITLTGFCCVFLWKRKCLAFATGKICSPSHGTFLDYRPSEFKGEVRKGEKIIFHRRNIIESFVLVFRDTSLKLHSLPF